MARAALARPLSVRPPVRPLPRGPKLRALEPLLYDRTQRQEEAALAVQEKTV